MSGQVLPFDVQKAEAIFPEDAVRLLKALRQGDEGIWLQTFRDGPPELYSEEERTSKAGRPYTVHQFCVAGIPAKAGKSKRLIERASQTGNYTFADLESVPFNVANSSARVGVFFCVNTLQPDAERRSSDTVQRVAAVFLDLDGVPLPVEGFAVPPTAIVESSPGRFHIYWATLDLPLSEFTATQKHLAALYGGDESVSDLARVMRLPGYWHGKQETGFLSQLIQLDNAAQYSRIELLEGFPGLGEALAAAEAAEVQRLALAEHSRVRAQELRAELASGTVTDRADAQRKYGQAALFDEIGKLGGTLQGGRNNQLFKSSAALGECVAAGVLDLAEVESELMAAALAVGLDQGEAETTLQSGLTKGQQSPRDLSNVGQLVGKKKPKKAATQPAAARVERQETSGKRSGYSLPLFPKGTQEGTDAANAHILAMNGLNSRMRYTIGEGWYVYQPQAGVWKRDPEQIFAAREAGAVLREVVGQYLADAFKQRADEEERKRINRWATAVCGNYAVENALRASASRPEFLTDITAWDVDPFLLNCTNGVLDLKAGTLRPHSSDDLMTWQAGAAFDPEARHPYVDALTALLRLDGREEFLQRSLGSALCGLAPNETITVHLGPGGTGKGTYIAAAVGMLGDYAGTIEVSLLLNNAHGESSTGPKPELLMLRGKRLVVAGEPPKGARFNAGRVKGMTGNDPITARGMRSNTMVSFTPVFKLWLHSNYSIGAAHDDSGMERRMRVVPFNARPNRAEPKFKHTLEHDPVARSALLNWALEGFRLWESNGYELGESAEINKATRGYLDDQNPYKKFASENLIFDLNAELSSTQLKALFERWAEENGARMGRNVKMADLYTFLASQGCEPGRTKSGRLWHGVSERVTEVTPLSARPQVTTSSSNAIGVTRGQADIDVTSVTKDDVLLRFPVVGEL